MRTRNVAAALAVALALVPVAAGCGGNGSANGSSASLTSQSGTTSAMGSAAGHSFTAQIASLGAVVDRLSNVSSSAGSGTVATDLRKIQQQLGQARGRLATTTFPSALQPQKQQLMTSLDQWSADLSQAESTARQGHTKQALQQAQSTTYRDLKGLLDTVRSVTG